MRIILPMLILVLILPVKTRALELELPPVPDSAVSYMPDQTGSFAEGFNQLISNVFSSVQPEIGQAIKSCSLMMVCAIIIGVFCHLFPQVSSIAEMAGAVSVSGIMLSEANAMIHLGADTILEMSEYGKLLFPVLTAGLAAQGGVSASASLYAGSLAFLILTGSLISTVLLPLVNCFLALAVASAVLPEKYLKRMKSVIKNGVGWCLKTVLTVFTAYLSITGVVSGSADAAALKAAKVAISSFVPVVGGILSDASESVLITASIAKNTAGIYGIFAVLAVFLTPFLKIGVQYLVLKMTSFLCELMGSGNITELIDDFSTAMGLILAMTAGICLILLFGTVCFLKGVG